jgi:hypothetical protein
MKGCRDLWTCRKCQNNRQSVIMKLWGHFYLFVVCFLIFCVVCKWWALFCILHGMGGARHCSTWSVVLSLDGMRNGRRWMASTRQSFQSGEAKFFDSWVFELWGKKEDCASVFEFVECNVSVSSGEGWIPLQLIEPPVEDYVFFPLRHSHFGG